jgi:hypothetical protein
MSKPAGGKAAFAGHFSRVVVSNLWSLLGDIVSEALSGRQSPVAKIPFLAAGWRDAIRCKQAVFWLTVGIAHTQSSEER